MTTTQTRKRLTKTQMQTIHDVIASDPDTGWVKGVTETFRCFGVNLDSEDQEPITCSDYAIPEDQWKQICQWCLDYGPRGNDISRVNHGLDWMNYGPSSYDPLEET